MNGGDTAAIGLFIPVFQAPPPLLLSLPSLSTNEQRSRAAIINNGICHAGRTKSRFIIIKRRPATWLALNLISQANVILRCLDVIYFSRAAVRRLIENTYRFGGQLFS